MTTAIPDLASYDVIEISTSAGKDSLAMLWHVSRLARKLGLLDRVIAIHADLGRVDWPGTSELACEQADHLGVRSMVVSRPQGDILEHAERMGKWPTPSTRYCTSDHKRGQILTAFTGLAREVRASWPEDAPRRPVRILNCVGLRAEESPGRAKAQPLKRDPRSSSREKQVDIWLPIHDWSEAKVWEAVRASGARVHPAYGWGLPRASCVFCIYAPEEALQLAGLAHPELLMEYVRVEQKIGHKFKKSLPLAKVASDLLAGAMPSPKTIKNWRM